MSVKDARTRRKSTNLPETETGSSASAPRIYNLFPLLVGGIDAWREHLPRIARLGFDWVYLNPFHSSGFSGSLYAIKDHYAIDPRFLPTDADPEAALSAFLEDAGKVGLSVMMDLVVNHTAFDANLAAQSPHLYRRAPDGSFLKPSAADPDAPGGLTVWGDLAELDYAEPQSRGELVEYWGRYLAHYQGMGFRGFRCDAAYMVPPNVWRSLIEQARARGACLFVAETLGCTPEETSATAEAGFDFLFDSFAWWDLKSDWYPEQREATRLIAPSIAFPENHDTPRLAAQTAGDPAATARNAIFRYALAACVSEGVLVPMGYESGATKRLDVVTTSPADMEEWAIDISGAIAAWNGVKAALAPLNMAGALRRLSAPDAAHVAFLRLGDGHEAGAGEACLVLANPGDTEVSVEPGPLIAGSGGLFDFADATPDATPLPLQPGRPVALEAKSVRLFYGKRMPAPKGARGTKPDGEGRVVIERVLPELDGGLYPVKRVVGDTLDVSADIFSDGHEKIAADLLVRASDEAGWRRYPMTFVDNDRWSGKAPLTRNIEHVYTVEAWRDAYASWRDEVGKKRAAGQILELEAIEGVSLVEGALARAKGGDKAALTKLLKRLQDADWQERIAILLDEERAGLVARHGERHNVSRYARELPLVVDRMAAIFSAWYELFPRSMSDEPTRHGTFDDVIAKLPYVRDMGFDVLYFPPVHPIGTINRKGRNNTLTPAPDDPGSVYAIGSKDGGHRDIHPELGTIEDFRRLVAEAHRHGLEIALDFAIQCAPDHPWIEKHPEWFDWRPDGTLKYAENPPKKYEDIVNVHFYGKSLPSLWEELRDTFLFWAGNGVRIFRVDNPHTKPVPFWRWVIKEVNATYPDVIFLAEAFTRPKMMRQLAKVGFQQSYTYFTWRNTKSEITDYVSELAHGEMSEYYRPNFFANTPDINPYYLQTSGPAGFVVRATLAATLSSIYGLYSGFELAEGRPIAGKEEYIDSEKYEVKAWDWDRPGNIRAHVTALNRIRRGNPALWDFRNILFLNAWNDQILAYAKMTPARDNVVLVLVNLDPHHAQGTDFELPLWEFGLPDHASIDVEDLLTGETMRLTGKVQHRRLDPATNPVIIWRLVPPRSH